MITMRNAALACVLMLGACGASASDVDLQVLQGGFQSASDRQALVQALAKAVTGETRLSNPTSGTGDGAADDQLGYAVALSGNTALIGARSKDVGVNGAQGAAYVFVRSGTVWTRQAMSSGAVWRCPAMSRRSARPPTTTPAPSTRARSTSMRAAQERGA